MTPAGEQRIRAAVVELADAIVSAIHEPPANDAPDELLTVEQATQRIGGIARSTLYRLIQTGDVRSVKVGRRRLIPSTAIAELAQSPPEPGK